MARRDTATLDLFRDFQPPSVVERFDADRVRAATHAGRIARAVSEALRDRDRKKVAEDMSAYLGEDISKAMLDAYASAARETHNIPAHRLVALAVVIDEPRLFNVLLDGTGRIAIAAKYELLIRREMALEARDRFDREALAADAQWKARR